MATSSTTPFESRIPQEPLPVPPVIFDEKPPSVDSEEESFVVLGKYPTGIDFEYLSSEDEHSNFGKSIIQEAKQLLKDELDKIENSPIQPQPIQENVNGVPENIATNKTENAGDTMASQQSFHSTNSFNGMEQSSVLPAMPQPQMYSHAEMDGNDASRTISIISIAPSEFPSEELQSKISQVIEENIHLKDTIMQNNMSMKAQYEKIVAWQKDVEKVHEAHKDKFRQAKQCIEALKKENALFQLEIENLRYTLKFQDSEKVKSKQIIAQSSENNLKEFELDAANKKIQQLEETIEKLSKNSGADVDTENKWRAMEEKLARYEKELEDAYKKNRDLEKNNIQGDLASSVEKLKITEEKLQLAEKATEQANQEILSLRNHLAKNLQVSEESPKMLHELQQAKNKIKELEDLLTSRNASLIDANMRSKKIEEEFLQAKENIKTIEGTTVLLQQQLEETKIEVWKNKQKLSEKEAQLQVVQKELEASQQQKQLQEATCSPNEIAYLRQQLMQSQMAMTQCDQNRAVAYAQLEIQKNEIADLQRQLQEKQNETDAMLALRTQLDLYKTDFEAERDAKEDVKREKNKLCEDLQHLHRRNQQLQEEIEILRDQLKQYGGVQRTRHDTSTGGQGAAGWATERGRNPAPNYTCPKCQFGFSTINAVENHIVRCIELDDSLP